MNNPKPQELTITSYKNLWLWLFIVFVIWSLSWAAIHYLIDADKRGVFGDMFGAVNALFSGLAFAGLIFTILLQSKELKLQQQELKLTREELKGQKEQMSEQNKVLQTQNFENTFFQLLKLHSDIVNSMEIRTGPNSARNGRDCLRYLADEYSGNLTQKINEGGLTETANIITSTYSTFYSRYQHLIGHYFRSLYTLIKFVNASNIDNKRLYTNIVRAQLSNQELQILFYNGISEFGVEKFKPLIEKYALLKSLDSKNLLHESHKSFYIESAYISK